jgi:DNA-binding NarL/FixJ family response regulator
LLLTDDTNDPSILELLKAGAQGCIQKSLGEKNMIESIRDISMGNSPISPNIAFQVLNYLRNGKERVIPHNSFTTLSQRELAVLGLLAEGLPNKMIGNQLNISERTVEAHVRNILKKLNATSRTHAAFLANKSGILPLKELSTSH